MKRALTALLTITAALMLLAAPAAADWEPGDGSKMHWPQTPDLSDKGMDVDMFWAPLADDFLCTQSGPIKDIHFWGSFAEDILPANGPGSLTFKLTLYSDIPKGEVQPWSMPGQVLWSETFRADEYDWRQVDTPGPEDWYDPATEWWDNDNHNNAYQYNFYPTDPYPQEADTTYWLEIQDLPRDDTRDYTFGWKTTTLDLRWNDDAAWFSPQAGWLPLKYPQGHEYQGTTLDLAFVITPEPGTLVMLLGASLVGMLALLRRRLSKTR